MKVRKESVITYLFIFVLIGAGMAILYLLNAGFTGFATYTQANQTDFNGGTYNNTEYNGSAVVLSPGQISGTYSSKIFDVNGPTTWNNISWVQGGYYQKELPDNQGIETRLGGVNMSGNVLLMHMNELSGGALNTVFEDNFSDSNWENRYTLLSGVSTELNVVNGVLEISSWYPDKVYATSISESSYTYKVKMACDNVEANYDCNTIFNFQNSTSYLQYGERNGVVRIFDENDNDLITGTATVSNNVYYWYKVTVTPNKILAKHWLANSSEPSGWEFEINNGATRNEGSVGFSIHSLNKSYVSNLLVTTNPEIIADTSGQGNNGTNNGATYGVSGKFNTALSFNGVTGDITLPATLLKFGTGNFSSSFWVKRAQIGRYDPLIWFNSDGASGASDWWLRFGSDNTLEFLIDKGSTVDQVRTTDTYTNNVWYNVVIVRDSGSTIKIYVDGKEVKSAPDTAFNIAGSTVTSDLANIGTDYFNGKLDEVAIWNRVLSAQEIKDIYERGALRLNLSVRSCNDSVCSGENFVSLNDSSPQTLSGLINSNQYFQYKFGFSTDNSSYSPELYNVTLNYTSLAPIINIISPKDGEGFNYNTSLRLNFTIINSTSLDDCWYTLDNGIKNITLANCQNTTFNAGDGNYLLTLYANDSFGNIGSSSVNFIVSAIGVSLSLTGPSGIKTSRTNIPITYTATGNNLTCWYNVKTSIEGYVLGNTTLANCSNSEFDVSVNGDYIFNLYANNTFGAVDFKTSPFTISTSSESSPVPASSSGGGGGSNSGSTTTIIQTTNLISKLTGNSISDFIVDSGENKSVTWKVKNTGTNFLNDCTFESSGNYSSWIKGTETKSLAAGEEYDFVFNLNVPKNAKPGSYELGVVLNCKEVNSSVKFNVDIIEKKLKLDLLNVVREKNNKVRINYSLEELSGINQKVNLQFLLFKGNEKVAETLETKFILANSTHKFESFINIPPSLEGNLNLLINLNSKTYSTFVQENVILGPSIIGFSTFGNLMQGNSTVSYGMIFLFFIFAVVIIRRIFVFRNKIKNRDKNRKNKKEGINLKKKYRFKKEK